MADVTEKLKDLVKLLDRGLLSRAEFDQQKQALLAAPSSPQGSSPNLSDSVGAYRILGELGRGGMGVVYRGKHRTAAIAKRQGGEVAIKVLHAQYAQDEVFRDRFEREASLGLKLEHPGIVKVHDLVVGEGGTLAIAMELAEGRPLSEVIGQETGPIPWDRAWPLFKQLLNAVDYAHAQGVVHRDLKPENVILSSDNRLKILDFGIAKDMEGGKTKTGTGMGTVDYMAPEQYLDAKRVDGRADIYALGMTLYEMLAGRLPWEKNTPEFTILEQKKNGALPPPTDFYPAIPPAVVAVVERATAVKIEDRYRSIKALTAALEGASGDGVSLMEDEAPKLVIGGGSPSAPAAPFKVGSRPKELLREEYPTLGWQLSKLFLMVVVAVGVSVVVIGFKMKEAEAVREEAAEEAAQAENDANAEIAAQAVEEAYKAAEEAAQAAEDAVKIAVEPKKPRNYIDDPIRGPFQTGYLGLAPNP
jgi:serine/threonine protein kinase